jgi:endonuclease/exonuclease/phosphatase (EEP) superfamily protein YafD
MKILKFLALAFGLGIGLVSLMGVGIALAGPLGWPFELFSSWPFLVAGACLLGAAVAALCGWRKLGALGGVACAALIGISVMSPGVVTRQTFQQPASDHLTLVWGNVFSIPAAANALAQIAFAHNDAILAYGELPDDWQLIRPSGSKSANFVRESELAVAGCAPDFEAIYSDSIEQDWLGERIVAIKTVCPHFTLYAVHLTNPLHVRGKRLNRRNREFKLLATALAAEKGPLVVVGDFNTAPNVPTLARFAQEAGLTHVACGGRWQPTWRLYELRDIFKQDNPLTGIPIDHLFTRDINVVACRVGPDFGSDHLPLMVVLQRRAGVEAK